MPATDSVLMVRNRISPFAPAPPVRLVGAVHVGVVVVPFQARLRAYLRGWDLPLWNPYSGLGQPFAATAVVAIAIAARREESGKQSIARADRVRDVEVLRVVLGQAVDGGVDVGFELLAAPPAFRLEGPAPVTADRGQGRRGGHG